MSTKKHNIHDRGYKLLFSNRTFVEKLITSFVSEKWVKSIDFSSLKRFETSFVSEEFKERECDILYRVKYRNKNAYILLLIEFQSTVDPYMALRVLRYTVDCYEMLIKEKGIKKGKKLPPLFPLVLYNGEKAWDAPTNFKDLIEDNDFGAYIPDFRYYRICENEFSYDELLAIGNLVSALFFIENADREKIEEHLDAVSRIVGREKDREAIRFFSKWLTFQFENSRVSRVFSEEIDHARTKKEVSTMFSKTAQELKKSWLEEGIQKGIQKGKQEGLMKGEEKGIKKGKIEGKREGKREGGARLLVKLLKKKFGGRFSPEVERRIEGLDLRTIERISIRIFEMNDIKEVERFL